MRFAILIGVLCAVIGVAGCGDDGGSGAAGASTASQAAAFPVTIPHAFGQTTIEAPPTRVVAWGWGSADAAIVLGVIPVAIPFQSYGGDAKGVLPWIAQALEADGVPTPTVLPDSEEPPYEEIAAAKPDVILAPYSGVTKEQYDLLSAIAPTVAYPGEAWATPWRETIRIVGTALGKDAEAICSPTLTSGSPPRRRPTPSSRARRSPWSGTPTGRSTSTGRPTRAWRRRSPSA